MRLSPQARCTLPMGSREAGTDGSWTHRWSETDSNPRSLSEGTCGANNQKSHLCDDPARRRFAIALAMQDLRR